jgi:toxin ParE1/3/4
MKIYSVVIAPFARGQLEDLYDYISNENGEARAQKFVGRINSSILSLSTFPERGTRRDDLRPNLRIMGYARRVTIVFSVDKKRDIVMIHGVFYGGQNYEAMIDQIDPTID